MSEAHEDAFLRRAARQLLRDHHLAEDVVQEALLASLRRNGDVRHQRRFLLGVVRHLSIDVLRSRERRDRRESLTARPAISPSTDDVVQERRTRVLLRACIRSLPPHYERVLRLRYYEGLPPRVIARELELPVETVRTRIKRGLAQLRGKLEEEYGGDRQALGLALAPLASAPRVPAGDLGAGTAGALRRVGGWLLATACFVPFFLGGSFLLGESGGSTVQAEDRPIGTPPDARGDLSADASVGGTRAAAATTLELELRVAGSARPVSGAAVEVAWEGNGSVVGTSDERGRLTLGVGVGELDVTVLATGLTGEARRTLTPVPGPNRLRVPSLRTATGRVLDESLLPLAGATVELWTLIGDDPDELLDSALTDGQGRYVLAGAPESFALDAHAGGLRSQYVVFADAADLGSNDDLDFVLRPVESVEGVVLDGEGHPLAGIEVFADALAGPSLVLRGGAVRYRARQTTVSGEDGRFRFDGLPGAGWRLIARQSPLLSAWRAVEPGDGFVELQFVHGRPRTVLVVDPDGRPIEGAEVTRLRPSSSRWGSLRMDPSMRWVERTDACGAATFENELEELSVLLTVRAPGYGTSVLGPVMLPDRYEVVLRAARTVEGRVSARDGRLASGEVRARVAVPDGASLVAAGFLDYPDLSMPAAESPIAGDGQFSLDVPAVPIELVVEVRGDAHELDLEVFDLGSEEDRVRLALPSEPTFAGRVVDATTGDALGDVSIDVHSAELVLAGRVHTAPDGSFRLTLPEARDWIAIVEHEGHVTRLLRLAGPSTDEVIELGTPTEIELRVLEAGRRPLPEALLLFEDHAGEPLVVATWGGRAGNACTLGPLGTLRVCGLPAGEVRVSVVVPWRAEPRVFVLDTTTARDGPVDLWIPDLDRGREPGAMDLELVVDPSCVAPGIALRQGSGPDRLSAGEGRLYLGPVHLTILDTDGVVLLTLAGELTADGFEPAAMGTLVDWNDWAPDNSWLRRDPLLSGPGGYAASAAFADPERPLAGLPVPLRGGRLELALGDREPVRLELPDASASGEPTRVVVTLPAE